MMKVERSTPYRSQRFCPRRLTSKGVQRPLGISRSQYAGNSRSAFNLMMYCAASRSVTSGFRPTTMIGSKNR
jgi:hypothetical protein